MKVIFVWRGPSPYRVDFFNELGKYCNLTVMFEMRPQDISDKKQSWFNERFVNFDAIYLKGRRLFGRVWFCPDVFDYIKEMKNDTTKHAEILAIQKASKKLNTWRLTGCTMYVTLEPCVMCAGAMIQSRLDKVVFGTVDEKTGACGSVLNILQDYKFNHIVEIGKGVMEKECKEIYE